MIDSWLIIAQVDKLNLKRILKLETPGWRPGFRQATIELCYIFGAAASTSSEISAAYFSKFFINSPPRHFALSS